MLGRGFSSSCGLLGVDCSGAEIRLLQMRFRHGQWGVTHAASMPAAPILDTDDLTAFTERLRSVRSTGGFTARRAVVVLPREYVLVQSVRLPLMSEQETDEAVRWEASQRFSREPEQLEVDCIRTGAEIKGQDQRQEVLIVASERARALPLLWALVESGLRPIAAETSFTAVARAVSLRLRRASDVDTVRVVVEMGRSGTTVMVLRGDQIAFCKPLTFGGTAFDEAASEHLGVDLDAAREIRLARINAGAGDAAGTASADPETDRVVYESIRPCIGQLAKEITLALRYYGVTFRGNAPSAIILAGPEAGEPHLAEVLERACRLPVMIDDAHGSLATLHPLIHEHLNRCAGSVQAWAAAIGACAREAPRRTTNDSSTRAAA